jgi:uncharacterized coiled-coil protein SlyX
MNLDELDALYAKATPPQWVGQLCEVSDKVYIAAGAWPLGSTICELDKKNESENSELICVLHNEYPALSARIRELEAALDSAVATNNHQSTMVVEFKRERDVLQGQVAALSNALAQCRDTVNPHDDKDGWDISIGEPSAVPDLVKRRFDALAEQVAAMHETLSLVKTDDCIAELTDETFETVEICLSDTATITAVHDARVRNLAIENVAMHFNGVDVSEFNSTQIQYKIRALKTGEAK